MSMEYPESMFQTREPIDYLPFEDTTATLVDTPEALVAMLQDLKAAKEIAIDLEHHDQRSYVGFTCLMQVSTREKDWIVDTLQLRSELQILNDVFADPSIVKVCTKRAAALARLNTPAGSSRCKYGYNMASARLWPIYRGAL